jgi:hypothetical protein
MASPIAISWPPFGKAVKLHPVVGIFSSSPMPGKLVKPQVGYYK